MFRIWIYLKLNFLFSGLFLNKTANTVKFIKKKISNQSKKKYLVFSSQCRVGFLFILKFLKNKSKKREIIFCAYNLPEMINIAVKLNYKVIFCDLNYQTGAMEIKDLRKKISKKTSAIVLTNMFNNPKNSREIKMLANKNKITLIEDNAIYFDNFTKKNGKKIYSGCFGDFSIYSFNIMKNISSLYGGAVSTNNKDFIEFYEKEYEKLNEFSVIPLIKQILIYLILKLMAQNFLYKFIFIRIIRFAHFKNIKSILKIFYPSLKSVKKNLPKYYFTKMSNLAIILTYLQLKDEESRKKIFNLRKQKQIFYFDNITKIPKANYSLIKKNDKNFQNYLDFPILVKNKELLNKYLLNNGIEVRYKHYYNCEKLFKKKTKCKNAEKYENELICLPIHSKISFVYMNFVINNLKNFFNKSNL